MTVDPTAYFTSVCAYKDQRIDTATPAVYDADSFNSIIDILDITYDASPESFSIVPNVGLQCISPSNYPTLECSQFVRVLFPPTNGPAIQGFYLGIQSFCRTGDALYVAVEGAVTGTMTTQAVTCRRVGSDRFIGVVNDEPIRSIVMVSTFQDYGIFAVGLAQSICSTPPINDGGAGGSRGSKGLNTIVGRSNSRSRGRDSNSRSRGRNSSGRTKGNTSTPKSDGLRKPQSKKDKDKKRK
jgi:hypothetical protein